MDLNQISSLLKPFVRYPPSLKQLESISIYINILLRWNQKVSLTAVRDPEEIVTRHFGESLFAAQQLFGPEPIQLAPRASAAPHVLDLGSGAGFPGLPIKIWSPQIHLALVESNQKKATFLREVVRALRLADVRVYSGRAEQFSETANVVTIRAVERFESILPTAARLVRPGGRIALMIGRKQFGSAKDILASAHWEEPKPIPQSESRIVVIGRLQ